ncbi:protein of unknown function [Nitratireductor aquimarinus]
MTSQNALEKPVMIRVAFTTGAAFLASLDKVSKF